MSFISSSSCSIESLQCLCVISYTSGIADQVKYQSLEIILHNAYVAKILHPKISSLSWDVRSLIICSTAIRHHHQRCQWVNDNTVILYTAYYIMLHSFEGTDISGFIWSFEHVAFQLAFVFKYFLTDSIFFMVVDIIIAL